MFDLSPGAGRSWPTATAGRASASRACWPGGWSSMACRSCRSTGATTSRRRKTAGDGGWDHHYRNFQIMQDRHAPWLDQAYAALLHRPAAARPAGDGRWWWRSASSAARRRSTTRPAASTGSTATAPWSPAAACAAAGSSAPATPAASSPHDRPLTPADLAATIHHCVGITSEQAADARPGGEGQVIEELF